VRTPVRRYDDFVLGSRWQVGPSVALEVTERCDPCRKLALLPSVGDERVLDFMAALLGRRGRYARVLDPGEVAVGDVVTPLKQRV